MKKIKIKHPDLSQLARAIVEAATEEDDQSKQATTEKNPHFATLGRLGGPARSKKLSKEKRIDIAKKAAQARWNKK